MIETDLMASNGLPYGSARIFFWTISTRVSTNNPPEVLVMFSRALEIWMHCFLPICRKISPRSSHYSTLLLPHWWHQPDLLLHCLIVLAALWLRICRACIIIELSGPTLFQKNTRAAAEYAIKRQATQDERSYTVLSIPTDCLIHLWEQQSMKLRLFQVAHCRLRS